MGTNRGEQVQAESAYNRIELNSSAGCPFGLARPSQEGRTNGDHVSVSRKPSHRKLKSPARRMSARGAFSRLKNRTFVRRRAVGRRTPNLGLCKVHKNFQQCGKFLCKTENFPKPKIQHFAQKSAYIFVHIDEGCSKLHKKFTSSLCIMSIENGL